MWRRYDEPVSKIYWWQDNEFRMPMAKKADDVDDDNNGKFGYWQLLNKQQTNFVNLTWEKSD